MPSLKDSAIAYEKRDIFSLDKIPVDIEIKTKTFTGKDGKPVEFQGIEIDGWTYTIKAKYLDKIKQTLKMRPDTKFVKAEKSPEGELYFVPVD